MKCRSLWIRHTSVERVLHSPTWGDTRTLGSKGLGVCMDKDTEEPDGLIKENNTNGVF